MTTTRSSNWSTGSAGPTVSRRTAVRLLITAGVLPVVGGGLTRAPVAHAAPAPGAQPMTDAPLADLPKSDLTFDRLGRIHGRNHRVTFFRAAWHDDEGQPFSAIVRDIEVRAGSSWLTVSGEAHRFDEQWVIHTGDADLMGGGSFAAIDAHWLIADSLTITGDKSAELTAAAPGVGDLTIQWDVSGDHPELRWSLTAQRDDNYVVGYYAGNVHDEADIDEVLCGPLQHARVIGSQVALMAWELFAPMALIQSTVGGSRVTTGTYIPGDVMLFEHPRMGYFHDQPFGMSLRNRQNRIQTCVYAPPGGLRSALSSGESIGYAFGLTISTDDLYDTQVALSRNEYGLTRYRQNINGQSMTDTVHNIIDLVSIEPDGDDSVDFIPSFSGWWSRGKGFANIEGDQEVRTAAASVLLSANLLASAPDNAAEFWERRARPLVEHIFSRRDVGHSPKQGFGYDEPLCGLGVGDVSTLTPVWALMKGQAAGLHRLTMQGVEQRRVSPSARSPFSFALSAYQLTDDPAWLAEAVAVAKRHIRDEIDTPYTTNISTRDFGVTAVKAWLELLVLFDLTGDEEFLRASHKEAKRYLGMFMIRPVPDGQVSTPVGEPIIDQYYQWTTSPGIPEYPRELPPTQVAPKWEVSETGLTFEQLSTYLHAENTPGGGLTLNPIWAPFLLRLAELVDDEFMRDLTHNMVIGRFTNYPGYYHRQYVSWPGDPRFPLEGPPGTSALYYHHAPGQLGLAMDYLISEQVTRSGGKISFPYAFECVFVFFKYHTYGHAPGEFYGDTGVWPYFPRGIVSVDNPQLNWLTGVSDKGFYLSVSNASPKPQHTEVTFDPELTGIDPRRHYEVEVITEKGSRRHRMTRGRLKLHVAGHGLTAVKIPGAGRLAPWHHQQSDPDRSGASFHFDDFDGDDATEEDRVYAMALPRPDRSGYDAYIQTSVPDGTDIALEYRIGDGGWEQAPPKVHPYEWTIGVDDLASPFTYRITVGGDARPERTLYLPSTVTGALPLGQVVGGDLLARGSTTPADPVEVTARVRNVSGGAISGAVVRLAAPEGWTVDAETVDVGDIVDGATADVAYQVTPGTSAPAGPHEISAEVQWRDAAGAEQVQALTSVVVEVFEPLNVAAFRASGAQSWGPEDPITITVAIMNRGPVDQSGTAQVTVPAGWEAQPASLDWTVPGRELLELTVEAIPASAAPGSSGQIDVDPGRGLPGGQAQVSVLDPTDLIILPAQPGYQELGSWIRSSLPGYERSATRFSPDGVWGGVIEWSMEARVAGRFELSVWIPDDPTNQSTEDALYVARGPGGDSVELHVNQLTESGKWLPLGEYDAAVGDLLAVRVVAISGKYTRANAARFRKVD